MENETMTTPTLVFGEVLPSAPEEPAKKEPEQPQLNEEILTAEERKMVEDFSRQIDLTNSTAILQYGAGTQSKMASFSEKALENVKTKDLGEIGEMLSGVVTELKSFDAEEDEPGLLRKSLPQTRR